MSQASSPDQAGSSGRSGLRSAGIVGLVLVALLSLGFAGYTVLNPHTVTVTQQQLLTHTQSVYSVETQTVIVASTATSTATVTSAQPIGYGSYQVCNNYYGCYQSSGSYYYYPGYYYGYRSYLPCQSTSSNNVTCSGYLYQANNGCTLLAIPTANNPYPSYATTLVYEYYALHNLPSNAPMSGTWVTVSGQLYQGYNTAPNGASCPTNYIIVTSIS
jgi:hypothetical protein